MSGQSKPQVSTKQRILDCALMLLKEDGDSGLTMRRLADSSDMSLGNLQYHFKTRDDVLKAMVALHFEACIVDVDAAIAGLEGCPTRERAASLVSLGLKHGVELTDLCRIFRELWAISSRNEDVQDAMMAYYTRLSERLADNILGDTAAPGIRKRLQCLLLPFIEGYSVTGPALPLSMDQVASMLTNIVMAELDHPSGSPPPT